GFVREVHFDQHVAWKYASLGDRLFTALDFDDFFGGNENAPEGGLESRALDTLEKSLVHAFFHSGINVYDIPTLAHVCPLFPAEQQAINDPFKSFINDPKQDAHHDDERKDDDRHLLGFLARRPPGTLDFVVGVATEAQGPPAGFAEPGDNGGNNQAAHESAYPHNCRLAFKHGIGHNAGHNNKHRQTQLDAICATGNG